MQNSRKDILNRLNELEKEKAKLLEDLRLLDNNVVENFNTSNLYPEEKIKIFRSVFKGREDVYVRRFENSVTGKCGYYPVKNGDSFLPITDAVIKSHLQGFINYYGARKDFTAGVYPLLPDNMTNFLAVDFDEKTLKKKQNIFLIHVRNYLYRHISRFPVQGLGRIYGFSFRIRYLPGLHEDWEHFCFQKRWNAARL